MRSKYKRKFVDVCIGGENDGKSSGIDPVAYKRLIMIGGDIKMPVRNRKAGCISFESDGIPSLNLESDVESYILYGVRTEASPEEKEQDYVGVDIDFLIHERLDTSRVMLMLLNHYKENQTCSHTNCKSRRKC